MKNTENWFKVTCAWVHMSQVDFNKIEKIKVPLEHHLFKEVEFLIYRQCMYEAGYFPIRMDIEPVEFKTLSFTWDGSVFYKDNKPF